MVMQTGSMRPLIAPGDLVVVRPVPVGEIRIGDLITFREPTGSRLIVTHRVVGIEETDAGRAFTTRGDANPRRFPLDWQPGDEIVVPPLSEATDTTSR